ncbi:GTP-binding protein [Thermococcus chitonophagus]|uniref:Probable GTP-binding protein EngB n=1 Tax=Thermococcus chitonophagus TaxID=54262 RepID=A0A160VQV8_9EURY|nr:GTP-binding protein EngB [Thermococcus chitonophagus]ASJ15870.1 GTP-binding protein [Thermococcus chitonophagus]CUX77110.1 GTP-binding protein EngB [Thermococcus chitonophagus]
MATIIFVGRSNVGKSTLIYQLTGKKVRRGKRPGVTRKIIEIEWKGHKIIDMPGFGFMAGLPKEVQERIKDEIVHFIEDNADKIDLAILVVDGKAAPEIIERWEKRGEIPIDVEFYQFLTELNIPTLVAVNKLDKIKNVQKTLYFLADKFGVPWDRINDIFVPISAKFGDNIDLLKRKINEKLRSKGCQEQHE